MSTLLDTAHQPVLQIGQAHIDNSRENSARSYVVRAVFVESSAFLGRVDGNTRCGFWAEDPSTHDFDARRLISIDLALTPNAAIAGRIPWDAVQVDDCYTGIGGNLGGTTLGPRWPELNLYGRVLLEQSFRERITAELRPACPPAGLNGFDYEYTTVLYWPRTSDPRAGKRYSGHHAEIMEERGSVVRVRVFPPGTSGSPHVTPSTMWLDLASCDQCDAGPQSLTTIAPGDGPKSGALFLISGMIDEAA